MCRDGSKNLNLLVTASGSQSNVQTLHDVPTRSSALGSASLSTSRWVCVPAKSNPFQKGYELQPAKSLELPPLSLVVELNVQELLTKHADC